ncbi:hypothetical protein Syun_009251 [Stephania yunnanensis]|uniref:Beta-Casp domain-containing protein n=1 Tax=Stephania yunnanensis TaxID=152371 RepID=A0AAP0KEA9_9MAGN
MVGEAEAVEEAESRPKRRSRGRGEGDTSEKVGEGSDRERQQRGNTGEVAAAVAPARAGWMESEKRKGAERRTFINASGPCVLFASPRMISGGFSLEVFKQWAPFEKNLIALPGREAIHESQMIPKTQSRRSRGRLAAAEESGRAAWQQHEPAQPWRGGSRSDERAKRRRGRGPQQARG